MQRSEAGSIHVVIGAVIMLAVLGCVGYLFYVNNIEPNSKVSVGNTKAAVSEVQTSERISYCAKYEKICFEHPETWIVKEEKLDGKNRDAFSLIAPNDTITLAFESGIGAFDVCCGPMPEGDAEVVSASRAMKFGENAYVSEVITQKVEGKYPDPSQPIVKSVIKGYIPQVVLHESAALSKQDTFSRTNGSIVLDAVMNGQYATVDNDKEDHGSVLFGTVTFGITSDQKLFATFDEAKKQFDTEPYKQAKEILLSAKYR